MDTFIGVFSNVLFLFLRKIKFGCFMRVLKMSDKILGQILLKNPGLRGVRGGRKKNRIFFFHFDPNCICVPKMKFLGLKMKKFLFAGYTMTWTWEISDFYGLQSIFLSRNKTFRPFCDADDLPCPPKSWEQNFEICFGIWSPIFYLKDILGTNNKMCE